MTYINVIRVYVNISMSYEYFLSVLSPYVQAVVRFLRSLGDLLFTYFP